MTIPFSLPAVSRPTINIGDDRRITILCMICHGWERVMAVGDVNSKWKEVPITTRLRQGMLEVVPDKDIWIRRGEDSHSTRATVRPRGSEAREEVLRPDGKTDIPIAFTSIREELDEHDPHAVVECKRVAENDSELCREYVAEGIRRFVGGSKWDPEWPKYVESHVFGFMVAYLLSGTTVGAVSAINGRLEEEEHLRPLSPSPQDWIWASVHRRKIPLGPITLNHVFLHFD